MGGTTMKPLQELAPFCQHRITWSFNSQSTNTCSVKVSLTPSVQCEFHAIIQLVRDSF